MENWLEIIQSWLNKAGDTYKRIKDTEVELPILPVGGATTYSTAGQYLPTEKTTTGKRVGEAMTMTATPALAVSAGTVGIIPTIATVIPSIATTTLGGKAGKYIAKTLGANKNATELLSDIGSLGGMYGGSKLYNPTTWRTSWYNNLTPGSYSGNISWHPRGKFKGEIPQVILDYLTGKGRVQNPKWDSYFREHPEIWKNFPNGSNTNLHTDLRKEAYLIYMGMPHLLKYIINTGRFDSLGNPIYHLNVNEIPVENVQGFIENIAYSPKVSVTSDMANYGGNVNATKITKGNNFKIQSNDLFDVQPFLNPGRIAESMPTWMRKSLYKQIKNPEGSVYGFSYDFRPWSRWIKDVELGTITGGRPFRSITTIKGVLKPKDDYPLKKSTGVQKIKQLLKYINDIAEAEVDRQTELLAELAELENWLEEDWQSAVNDIRKNALQLARLYWEGLSESDKDSRLFSPMTTKDYYNLTGKYNYYKDFWK